jgi:hypothetical protein
MTGQIPDSLIYQGETYEIVSLSGQELVAPAAFGLQPESIHTACWRGYYCTYAVKADSLHWQEMTVRSRGGSYPAIHGVQAKVDAHGTAEYRGLDLALEYTGKILAGKDFIQERYVHMGFQAPSAYGCLVELTFVAGTLVEAVDRSGQWEQPVAPPPRPE